MPSELAQSTTTVTPTADVCTALDARHEDTDEKLTEFVRTNFSGSMLSLRQLKPFIEEIQRRFKHLPRKVGVDGKYKKIAGHRTFKSWCAGVLNRTDRAVHLMLKKARNEEKKDKGTKTEEVSVVLERAKNYLTTRIGKFQGSERIELLKKVSEILQSLSASTTVKD